MPLLLVLVILLGLAVLLTDDTRVLLILGVLLLAALILGVR